MYNPRMSKRTPRVLFTVIGIVVLAVLAYNIPFVHNKLAWRLDDLRTQIVYFLHPPDQAVFVPEQQAQIDQIVTATLMALQTTPTPTPTPSPDATASPAGPSPTPTITSTPLPTSVNLPGVSYVDQTGRWNYCGPANLTMALKFWGWKGQPGSTMDLRDQIAEVVKPGINDASLDFISRGKTDKNVMPYELADFVANDTPYHVVLRYGGSMTVLKQLIAAGYPVIVEKGYYEKDYTGKIGWLGHYQFTTGYDDTGGYFIVQDTWLDGPNFHVPYTTFYEGWRSFDYLFLVVYPADREQQVFTLLGNWADPKWGYQHALDTANQETQTQTGIDNFFAWFNKGTSHVLLQQYQDAATAYDMAFSIYKNQLGNDEKDRPFRIMWYQTWPYWAYYYTGRYHDVINLANTTLDPSLLGQSTLEESIYWRGMAEQALGDGSDAIADFKQANHLNPKMQVVIQKLQSLGITPEKPID